MISNIPFNLSRWFAAVGLVAIASISAVSAVLLSRFLTERMLHQEGRLTQEFVQSIILVEKAADYFSGRRVPQSQENEQVFEHIARMPDVLRANLHSRERVILWSSDLSLIGRQFLDNRELEQAIAGKLVVHSGEHVKVEHGGLDRRLENFVEIYSPVWDESRGEVVGVVELYKTPSALFEAIQTGQRAVWIGAAIAGIFLYAALFGLVRRADNLIRLQREQLVKSETLAAVGEMGSAVAHGIRNPLANIRSSAELSLESSSEQWPGAARDIVAEVDRLESWVRDLLSYSEPLAGKLEPIRVDTVVRASLGKFERDLQKRGIQASTNVGGTLPAVTADPLLLEQVFNSLIANAVEAIERNGRISVSVLQEGEQQLRVSIHDSGPGMTPEQLASAFRPFHTTKARGMGVGLPLARRIVERFGGTIALASEPGKGTVVDILLPAA
jgi:two-component system sensor histidine kinase HydH